MTLRPLRVLIGIIFITGGLLFLGRNLAIDPNLLQLVISGTIGFFGAVALVIFSFSPRWWLLPFGCALLTVALLQILFNAGMDNLTTITSISLLGLGGPFIGIYLHNHRRWFTLLPGFAMWAAGGLLLLLNTPFPTGWLPSIVMWALALPPLIIFASNRSAWWTLLLAYALTVLAAGLLLIANPLATGAAAAWLLWAAALPLWLLYLRNPHRVAILFTSGLLSVAGALPLLRLEQSQQPAFWLALGISIAVGLVWLIALLRRTFNQFQANSAPEQS